MNEVTITVLNKDVERTSQKKVLPEVFAVKSNGFLIAQSAKKYLSNQRKAGATTKTRSFVNGSGVKIWKQKGTGRARHGDRQAPIFVGGGVSHGPTGEQNYHLKINKKANRKAVCALLSEKLKAKKLFLIGDLEFNKTKQAAGFIWKVKEKFDQKGSIFLVQSKEAQIKQVFGNISGVEMLDANNINAYDLLRAPFVLMTKDALVSIEKGAEK